MLCTLCIYFEGHVKLLSLRFPDVVVRPKDILLQICIDEHVQPLGTALDAPFSIMFHEVSLQQISGKVVFHMLLLPNFCSACQKHTKCVKLQVCTRFSTRFVSLSLTGDPARNRAWA